MSAGHTPGPWQLQPNGRIFTNHADREEQRVGQIKIASVAGLFSERQSEADARLIAAAPELLEALEGLSGAAGEVSDFLGEEDWNRVQSVLDQYVVNARAAIAKARGDA